MKNLFVNKFYILTILIFVLVVGVFYWFAYRPARIKHNCSWVRMVSPATPIIPAITKDEASNSQLEYNKCVASESKPENNQGVGYRSMWADFACGHLLKKESPIVPAKSEQVWYRKANKTEYDFCIHESGL